LSRIQSAIRDNRQQLAITAAGPDDRSDHDDVNTLLYGAVARKP
jgi:hypothetical protein